MNRKIISGIYKIENVINNKVYIGQTVNLKKRMQEHIYSLSNGKHHNSILQRSFIKNGIQSFKIEVIEECSVDALDDRECYWIEFYESTNRLKGYNFESGGNSNKVIHQETRDKIRNSLKGTRLGKENPMFGKKASDYTINKMKISSQGTNSILTEEQVREIKISLHLGILQSDLVDIFNVDITTINKIAKAKNWEWLLSEFNDSQGKQLKEYKIKRKEKVIHMAREGYSKFKICKTLKIDHRTVDKYLEIVN